MRQKSTETQELTTEGLGAVDMICEPLGTENEVREKRRKPLEVESQNNLQECRGGQRDQ